MRTIDSSLQRYNKLRGHFDRLPADRDGVRMNLQFMEIPEENGSIPLGCRTDDNPDTHDILRFSSDGKKGSYRSETFLEIPAPRGWFGGKKGHETLVHLSRNVNHVAGGYTLAGVALRTVDLVTGELLSVETGDKAVKAAQKLDGDIPFRIHNIDPLGQERQEENWLLS